MKASAVFATNGNAPASRVWIDVFDRDRESDVAQAKQVGEARCIGRKERREFSLVGQRHVDRRRRWPRCTSASAGDCSRAYSPADASCWRSASESRFRRVPPCPAALAMNSAATRCFRNAIVGSSRLRCPARERARAEAPSIRSGRCSSQDRPPCSRRPAR